MNFDISLPGPVSNALIQLGIYNFEDACRYIAALPYRRNSDKRNILCLFEDLAGTCSTKHATIRKLAIEQNHEEVKLVLCIFKMDARYAPSIKPILDHYQLDYMPEAHNYLQIADRFIDLTSPHAHYAKFADKILKTEWIEFDQIQDYKIMQHQTFLQNWIADKPHFDLADIWNIREQCIKALEHSAINTE